jgi:phosphosulfolactate synthase (CoM biosynthesis protein A)
MLQDCKDVGFDILELNIDTLSFQEEELLRLIRLVKSEGLKAKPQLALSATDSNSFDNLERGRCGCFSSMILGVIILLRASMWKQ